MHLLFDGISRPARLIVLDHGIVRHSCSGEITGNPFETLLPFLENSRQAIGFQWSDIEGMMVVVGPIGFTAGRVITLTFNTLARVYAFPLQAIDFWQYCDLFDTSFPRILIANRAEALIQMSQNTDAVFTALLDLK